MHDLRLELAEGAAVPAGSLRALVDAMEDPGSIQAASERVVVPVSVDASHDGRTILVSGRLYGVELMDGGPAVDALEPDAGRALTAADDGSPLVELEYRFARFHELPVQGTVVVAGREATYVGQASTPEMFVVTTETGAVHAEAGFAGVFAGLATAQDLAGMPGLVNDLVLRTSRSASRVSSSHQRRAARSRALKIGASRQAATRWSRSSN